MKIKAYISILSILLAGTAMAQNPTLNKSGMEAVVAANGMLFKDGCVYPKGSNNLSFGESVVWMAGENGGDTFVSATNFNGVSDFQMGPLKLDGTPANPSEWQDIYAVSQNEIDFHTYNYKNASYLPEANIANWKGTAGSGFDTVIAPFVDWNRNKKYEPTLGDYPYIYGDQMAFSVYNDLGARTLTGNYGMKLNVIEMSSVYVDESNSSINNVVIKKMVVENKSSNNYAPFTTSIVTNIKLGDEQDNFIGSHVGMNFVYAYNGDTSDAAYGNSIPALVIFPLEKDVTISSSMYLTTGNEIQTGFPTNKKEVYNYMNGFWKNGKFLACGSAGLDGSLRCNYVYSGTTDPNYTALDWSEENIGNTAGERNVVLNMNHGNLVASGTIKFTMAYAIVDNYDFKVKTLEDVVNETRENFNKGRYTSLKNKQLQAVEFYPTLQFAGKPIYFNAMDNSIEEIILYNMNGEIVQEIGKIEEKHFILKDGLLSGMYFLSVKTKEGSLIRKLIVR